MALRQGFIVKQFGVPFSIPDTLRKWERLVFRRDEAVFHPNSIAYKTESINSAILVPPSRSEAADQNLRKQDK